MKFEFNIKQEKQYDVIVVGAGPAGVAAAVTAGRNGARTLLIESCGRVGGISTSGLMSHFTGRCGNRIYREILERSAQKNYFDEGEIKRQIDPELLTLTYIEMLEQANVDILLYTTFCDVIKQGNTVTGIICHNKGGFEAYYAKVVIDASGDGDVAEKSGVEYFKGRECDGKMQPATLMFKVAGVDEESAVFPPSFETLVDTEKGELQSLAREKLPHPAGHVLLYKSTIPGVVTVNMTNVTFIDGTKDTISEHMGPVVAQMQQEEEHHCCGHHHGDEGCHEHHHGEVPEHCGHHHEEHEHHHHEHGEHCCCGHHHEEHHHHEHDEHCCCGHHDEHHHHEHGEHCSCGHDHHHHHADEVFTSWGRETHLKFERSTIEAALKELDSGKFGMVLRAKGILPCVNGSWIHFDMVPEEIDIRIGKADINGKLCVIGSKLDEAGIAALFGV